MAFIRSGTGGGSKKSINYVEFMNGNARDTSTSSFTRTVAFDSGYLISSHGGSGTHYVRINGTDAQDDPEVIKHTGSGTTAMTISKIKKGDVITAYANSGGAYSGAIYFLAILKTNTKITDFYSYATYNRSESSWSRSSTCLVTGIGILTIFNGSAKINGTGWSGVFNNDGMPYDELIQTGTAIGIGGVAIKAINENDTISATFNPTAYNTSGGAWCSIKFKE